VPSVFAHQHVGDHRLGRQPTLDLAKAEARANAKLVAPAHAIQATVAESRGLPGASARERFKELVLNALVAEKLALKEIAHEPENTSIAEPAAEPAVSSFRS
jgi:hypothetical protein